MQELIKLIKKMIEEQIRNKCDQVREVKALLLCFTEFIFIYLLLTNETSWLETGNEGGQDF